MIIVPLKKSLVVCLSLLCYSIGFSQNNLETLVESINSLPPQHKIYVFHDKPGYVAGETVWLSTYLVEGSYHALNAQSKTIYVELYTPDLQLIESRMLNSPVGISWGEIRLPNDLPSGNYILRAYTNYMKNAGAEFFFQKEIPITSIEPEQVYATTSGQSIIRFFPEGGTFLIGATNRIAFKVTNEQGRGTDASGFLFNSKGEVLDTIQTVHDGMGEFNLVPAPDDTYYVKLDGDQSRIHSLPAVQFSGYAMSVTENEDSFDVFVYRNTSAEQGNLTIIAQSRNVIYFAASASIDNSTLLKVPKATLPTGITQITVFDEEGIPAAERLVFLNKPDGSTKMSLTLDKAQYETREKVRIEIMMEDPAIDTVDAVLSMSVYDKLSGDRKLSIREYLYLNSDLRGKVDNPAFYFSDDKNASKFADLLMRTHGWRRFTWNNISENQELEYSHEVGVPIRGLLKKEFSKKPVADAHVNILDTGTGGFALTRSDEQGFFFSDKLTFYDSAFINIQTENHKKNKVEYDVIITPLSPPVINFNGTTTFVNTTSARVEQSQKEQAIRDGYFDPDDVIVLEEVVIEAERIKNDMHRRLGIPDKTIASNTFPPYAMNVFELLRGRFAGIRVTGSPLNPEVSYRESTIRGGGQTIFFLDGWQVSERELLMILPAQIESIELYKGPSALIYGSDATAGVLAFYTKVGYQDFTPQMLGMNTKKIHGYSKARKFYSPDYGITIDRHNLPDHRSTLYWKPLVVPDASGHAVIEFFTGDLSTEYEVRIEGITLNGIPATGETKFSVGPSNN